MRNYRVYNLDRCTIGGSVREQEVVSMLRDMLAADPLNDRRVKHLLTFIEIQYSKINAISVVGGMTIYVYYRKLLAEDLNSRAFPELLSWFESSMTDVPNWIHLFHITRSVVVAKLRDKSKSRIKELQDERQSRKQGVPAQRASGHHSPEDVEA